MVHSSKICLYVVSIIFMNEVIIKTAQSVLFMDTYSYYYLFQPISILICVNISEYDTS